MQQFTSNLILTSVDEFAPLKNEIAPAQGKLTNSLEMADKRSYSVFVNDVSYRSSSTFADDHRILCHSERKNALEVEFLQLMKWCCSWVSGLLLIYQLAIFLPYRFCDRNII